MFVANGMFYMDEEDRESFNAVSGDEGSEIDLPPNGPVKEWLKWVDEELENGHGIFTTALINGIKGVIEDGVAKQA